jgi:hypothetical protein
MKLINVEHSKINWDTNVTPLTMGSGLDGGGRSFNHSALEAFAYWERRWRSVHEDCTGGFVPSIYYYFRGSLQTNF